MCTVRAKNSSISWKKWKFVQFWLIFLPICGGNGNSLNSFENSGITFEFTKPPKPDYTCEKFLDVLQGMEYFAIFLSKFGCHGNSLGLIEILDSISKVTDIDNLPIHAKKILDFLRRTEFSAIFAHFCTHLVVMATPMISWKFYAAYLNSLAPKTLATNSSISCTELKSVHFCLFLPKFGCHGNSLGSLKILDSTVEFADPVKPTIQAKIVSISCAEMK